MSIPPASLQLDVAPPQVKRDKKSMEKNAQHLTAFAFERYMSLVIEGLHSMREGDQNNQRRLMEQVHMARHFGEVMANSDAGKNIQKTLLKDMDPSQKSPLPPKASPQGYPLKKTQGLPLLKGAFKKQPSPSVTSYERKHHVSTTPR